MFCSYMSVDSGSNVTPSVSVLLYRYTTSRNMRSTIAFLKKNILTSGVARLPDKVAHLSLGNDQPSDESSSSNVVSRRIPRNITINRNRTQIMPKSVLGSHMSYVCNYMNNIRSEAHFKVNPPVLTFPHGLIDCLFESKRTTFMGLGYRFNPGQSEFIMHDARFPSRLMKMSYTCWMNSLHLSMSKKMLSARELCSFSRQDGMRSVLDLNYYKNLVEVITLFNGTFGRFLILTCSGIGCTVWYKFFPCIDGQVPMELFTPIVSYDPINNMDLLDPSYNCVEFTAQKDISEKIKSSFANVPPFSGMNIPASGVVLRNVCLGIMIAFLITTGVVDMSNVMNNV
ncbi:hypothetical protein LI410_mgp064 (mitochondrion) [Apium graveolens]|uniref:hypothetical protein n=1 Tax=Apium graveolens TaxID=4045 RepID=UPI001D02AA05|nr:hypothetical protein LI410_mgp107 [Apium graveolens]YP_010185162.1 hypothetical protein LI410_mgp064 [Apium graveolens]QVJ97877.1 hypothetical protein [Apium graveolens]QVJ97919.1 hypothetical protein [Apium graveolens]